MLLELFLIFILSIFFIGIIKNNAARWGLVDIPNERSLHTQHIPRGAGIGFYLAIVLVLSFFHFELMFSYLLTYIAILLISIVGILDDHKDTKPKTKFLIIILSTVLLYFDGLVINDIGVFFGVDLSLGWLALPFTIFAVTGFTNALNLIDGLDGLAAIISLIILSIFFFIGYTHNDLFMMLMSGAFISGITGFLIFNWYPASIFMGDSGSLTLGFVISVLAIKSLDYIPTISILFITAIPILDTLVVMIRRKMNGLSMFSADKCHMHHILRSFFSNNTPKTVLFLAIFQAIYSLTALQLEIDTDQGYILILFLLNTIFLYILLDTMLKKQNKKC